MLISQLAFSLIKNLICHAFYFKALCVFYVSYNSYRQYFPTLITLFRTFYNGYIPKISVGYYFIINADIKSSCK